MARVQCAICKEEGDTSNMYYCSYCNLWVHFECGGGSIGFIGIGSTNPTCPKCGRELTK